MDQPQILYDPDKVDRLDIPPFLAEVIQVSRQSVARRSNEVPLRGLNALTTIQKRPVPIARLLRQETGISLIASIKKQNLNGEILVEKPDYDPVALARQFVAAGARALAVTTNPKYYQGNLHHLALIAGEVSVPTIRQDFIYDEYQVVEARVAGADGLTLIASMLGQQRLRNLLSLTQRLRMTAIVVVHNEEELARALELDPRVIGINNRDWHNFEIDLERTARLSPHIPRHIVVVSMGGIDSPDALEYVVSKGKIDAVQVGEKLLKSTEPLKAVEELFARIDTDPADPWETLK
jgi:indole-3-glycerol phosphate synthase